MSDIVDKSLKAAVKGSGVFFFGIVLSNLFWFFSKILLVRTNTKEELGIYTIAIAFAGIIATISGAGLQDGIGRFVSIMSGEGRKGSAVSISNTAFQLGLAFGIASFLIVFLLSGTVSSHIFYKDGLRLPIILVSVFIPFYSVSQIMGGVMRGRMMVSAKVYMFDVGWPMLFLALLSLSVYLGMGLPGALVSYSLSMALVAFIMFVYLGRHTAFAPFESDGLKHARELMRFSLPLLATGVIVMVLDWTDTLMLGRYADAESVGIYSVSVSMAKTMTFFLASVTFVFLPLSGDMYAKGRLKELNRTYQVLTKWLFSATLPLFFVLFFFPEMSISFLFGDRFVESALPLRILALGFLVHAFMGANGTLMVMLGMPKTLMNISIAGTVLNIALNHTFIKRLGLGASGAATATMLSYVFINASISYLLYIRHGMHPFATKYARPILGSAVVCAVVYAIAKSLPLYLWMLPAYLGMFLAGYAVMLVLTKSIDREDIAMIRAIANRMGIESGMLDRVLSKLSRN